MFLDVQDQDDTRTLHAVFNQKMRELTNVPNLTQTSKDILRLSLLLYGEG